nr:kelch-like protein 24 [Lytechinus pictus]
MSVVLLPILDSKPEMKNTININNNEPGTSDEEVIIFRGTGHSDLLMKGLCDLWKDNQLTDIVLKVENRTFPCHRNVLAAVSPYFHRMFCSNMQESKLSSVSLKGISADSVALILDFAYTSELSFTQQNVPLILEAADMLLMTSVKEGCVDYMEKHLHPSNCLGIYTLAERFSCDELAEKVWKFSVRNFRSVRKYPEILDQSFEMIEKYLSTDNLVILDEEEVFETIIAWVNHSRKMRLNYLKQLLSHVREHLLPTEYLVDKVLSHPLLTKSESLSMTIEVTARHRAALNYNAPRLRSRSRRVVLVVGGIGPANIKLTEVKYFDPVDRRWSTFSHLPFDSEPVSCVTAVIDDVFVMGSRGSFTVHRAEDSQWVDLPSLPPERVRHRVACTSSEDGNLYFVGGFDGVQRVRLVDRFDTKHNMWHELEPIPIAVSSPSTVIFGNKLYVFGGALANGTATDLVYSYDLDDASSHRSWEARNPMPHAFSGITAVVLESYVYIVGSVSTVVHRYNPVEDSWSQAENMAETHALCGATVCDGKIYVMGGENQPNSPISEVEGYDPTTNRWRPSQNLPYPIRLHGCATVIKRI